MVYKMSFPKAHLIMDLPLPLIECDQGSLIRHEYGGDLYILNEDNQVILKACQVCLDRDIPFEVEIKTGG